MNTKNWGTTETGSVFHSFNGEGTGLCRKNVKAGRLFLDHGGRTEGEVDRVVAKLGSLNFRKCASCAKKEAAHRARVEASMAPVGEYDQVCEGITGHGDAAPAEGPCCDHAAMYHGARGCDECGCTVPRSANRAGNGAAPATDAELRRAAATGGTSARTVTQKPVIRATLGEARPAFESDPLRPAFEDEVAEDAGACVDGQGAFYPEHEEDEWAVECARCGAELVDVTEDETVGTTYAGQTPEEQRAAIVRRFPRGTRVQGPDSSGTWRSGVVNGYDLGTVTEPGHVNEGRVYLGVDWDPVQGDAGSNRRGRPFADELIIADEDAVREALGL